MSEPKSMYDDSAWRGAQDVGGDVAPPDDDQDVPLRPSGLGGWTENPENDAGKKASGEWAGDGRWGHSSGKTDSWGSADRHQPAWWQWDSDWKRRESQGDTWTSTSGGSSSGGDGHDGGWWNDRSHGGWALQQPTGGGGTTWAPLSTTGGPPATRSWITSSWRDVGTNEAGYNMDAAGRAPVEKVAVPTFDGTADSSGDLGTTARSYIRQVAAWQRMTRLGRDKQGLVLYQNLSGQAWVEAEALDLDRLAAHDGVQYYLQWVKDRFLDVQITQIGRGLSDFFRKLKRRQGQPIRDYIGEFDRCHARLQECGCVLPEIASAWELVDRMQLEEGAELNLLASVGNIYNLRALQQAAVVQDRALRKPWETKSTGRWNGHRKGQSAMYTGNEDDEEPDGDSEADDNATECIPEEVAAELHHAYVSQQNAKAKYREVTKGRGVDPSALKQTIEERLASAKARSFCAGCRRRGHWHKDPECPLNRPGAAGDQKGVKSGPGQTVHTVSISNEVWATTRVLAKDLLALVDTACSKTVAGTPWLQSYIDEAEKIGCKVPLIRENDSFRFGASKVYESTYAAILNFEVDGRPIHLKVAIIGGDVPLLVSRPALAHLGAVFDIGANVIDFRTLGVQGLKLYVTSTGHPAIPVRPYSGSCTEPPELPSWGHPEVTFLRAREAYMISRDVGESGEAIEHTEERFPRVFYPKKISPEVSHMLLGPMSEVSFLKWWSDTKVINDFWVESPTHLARIHVIPRKSLFDPRQWNTEYTLQKTQLLGALGSVRETTAFSVRAQKSLPTLCDMWEHEGSESYDMLWIGRSLFNRRTSALPPQLPSQHLLHGHAPSRTMDHEQAGADPRGTGVGTRDLRSVDGAGNSIGHRRGEDQRGRGGRHAEEGDGHAPGGAEDPSSGTRCRDAVRGGHEGESRVADSPNPRPDFTRDDGDDHRQTPRMAVPGDSGALPPVERGRGGQESGSPSGAGEVGQLRTAEAGADQLPDRDQQQPLRPRDECHRTSPTLGGVGPEQLGNGECGGSSRDSAPSPTCTLCTSNDGEEPTSPQDTATPGQRGCEVSPHRRESERDHGRDGGATSAHGSASASSGGGRPVGSPSEYGYETGAETEVAGSEDDPAWHDDGGGDRCRVDTRIVEEGGSSLGHYESGEDTVNYETDDPNLEETIDGTRGGIQDYVVEDSGTDPEQNYAPDYGPDPESDEEGEHSAADEEASDQGGEMAYHLGNTEAVERGDEDIWQVLRDTGYVIRVHYIWRDRLFAPVFGTCPVHPEDLRPERYTILYDGDDYDLGVPNFLRRCRVISDDWTFYPWRETGPRPWRGLSIFRMAGFPPAWEAPHDFGWVTQYNDQGEMQGFVRRSDLPRGQEQPDQPGGDNGPTGGATPEPGNSEADGPDETLFQWGIRTLRAELQTRGCEKGIPNRDQTLKTDHVAETPRSRPKRSTRRNLWRSAARILAITMTMLNVTTAYKNEHFGDYDNRAKGEADNTTDRGVRFKSTEVVYHLDNNFERREEDIEAEKLAKDERRTVNECIKWVLSSSWARDELGKNRRWKTEGTYHLCGFFAHGGILGLAQNSTTAPGLTRLLNRILRDRFPESKYAAMSLNIGCETPLHRDSHNVATCPNYVVLLEKPRWGGGLWVELGENDVMQGPVIPKTCPRGNSLFGQVRDLEKGTSFPPRRWHQSEPWDGQRVTLVGYTPLGYLRAPEGIVHRLRQLGFPLPDRRQIQHLRGSVRGEQERTLVKRSEKAKTSEGVYAVTDQGGSTKPGGAELSGNGIQFQKGVKPEVASALRRLHQNMAHPSNTELIRHLRIAGAEQKIIDAVKGMTCQSCARTRKPQNRRPAATANLLSFNEVVAIDIVSVYDIHNKRHDLLSILDVGSSYHTMVPLVDMKGPAVAEKFAERWINVFGAPECVAMDTDSIFQGALGELTSWYNMRTRPTAGQAHWQAGIIEKQGDLWKELWRRVVEEKSVESSDVPVAVAAVNSAKNELRRVSGFSPSQIVFGRNPKLPEDLIDNGDNLGANYLLTTDLKRQREVAIRTAARLSFHKLQVDDKLRRALLHQTRTRSRPVEVGESVFFFREDRNYKKGSTANHKLGRWRGPGVVIGFEGQNTWVSQAGRCFLVAPEHIRAPTGEELGEIFRLEATRSELDRLLARDLDDPTVYEEDMNPDRGEIGVVDGEMDFKSGDHGLATGWRERAQPRGEPGYEPIRRQRHKGPGPHDRDSSGTKDAYMMKRAKTSRSREKQMEKEIAWKDIPPELHEDFRAAERKQWNEHISNNAFEVLDADASEYYRKTIDPEYILDSRFAYRDKNYGRRKASPQENIPWKPKARLVIAGHRDPALAQGKTVSDAPTVSRASLIAVLQIAASHAWEIAAGDVEAAFLNGVELDRFLLMRQPRGGIDGLRPSQLLRVRKGVFGLAESPRRWFDKMNGDITREGLRLDSGDMAYFKPSPLDACVFMLQVNGEGPPLAYLTTHVDDILVAAPKNLNGLIRNELSRRFPISDWELDEFDYVGSHIRNDLEGIHITQAGYVDGRLFRVDVQKEQKDDDEANEEQRIDNMSAVGALSWLAAQTRPDLQCGVSMAQQVQGRPLVRDLKFTNSLVKRAESHRTCGIWLRPIPLGESIVVVFHDAAWANVPQDPEDEIYRLTSQEDELGLQHEGPYAEDRLRKAKRKNSQVASQIGHLVCLFHADALKGETCRPSVLEWRSQACQRVCRSTFAAETIACVEALEGGQFTRSLLASLRQGRLVKVEEAREGHRLLCLSDCRSLYDHLVKIGACRLPSNRTLAIDIAALKQDLALETRGKRLPLRWVPTTAQMGDPLTKPMRVEMWWRQLNDGYLFPFFEEDENNGEPV